MRVLPLPDVLAPPLLDEVLAARARGGVLGIPTDTLYGLAADPLSRAGCETIYALKGRPAEKAMPVLVSGTEHLEALGVRITPELLARLFNVWPAPLTVILPLAVPVAASGGSPTLAVRVPAHEELRHLLEAIGPLTATSANRSGEPAATAADEVARLFPQLDLVLDGGPSRERRPSTMVDLTGPAPRLLREGPVPFPAIA